MIIISVRLQIRHNKPRLEHPLRRGPEKARKNIKVGLMADLG